METAAEIFFEHFGLSPGKDAGSIHGIAEVFGSIPWENLSKFLLKASGSIEPRSPQKVMEDHLTLGTGGTCYSLTETLATILNACGVHSRPLTGHMSHGRNIHCALLAECEAGTFLMDPGYVIPGAVRLQRSGRGVLDAPGRRMTWEPVAGGWELRTEENGGSSRRYVLESRELTRSEFMQYWMDSFFAPGLESLHLNMAGPMGGRISAHNGNLRIVDDRGKRNEKLTGEYSRLVSERFGIDRRLAEVAWEELMRRRKERRDVSS